MTCITKLLELKGDKEFLPINDHIIIEGGGNYKGHDYLITFTEMGFRCGYVAIPPSQTYDSESINCHGGITFEGNNHAARTVLPVKCDDMWIGFDAGHCDDAKDFTLAKKYFPKNRFIDDRAEIFGDLDAKLKQLDSSHSIKTYEYMEGECKTIIEQLTPQAPSLQELQNTSKQC